MAAASIEEQPIAPNSSFRSRAVNFLKGGSSNKRHSQSQPPSQNLPSHGEKVRRRGENGALDGLENQPPHQQIVDDDAQDQVDGEETRAAGHTISSRIGDAKRSSAAAAPIVNAQRGATTPAQSPTQSPTSPVAARRPSAISLGGAQQAAGEDEDQIQEDAEEDDERQGSEGIIEFLHKGAPWFWLSNHFLIPVVYDNVRYASSEHLFQSLKFPHRPDIAKLIRRAETPSEAVRLARKHATDVRKGWRGEGLNIVAMREVLLLKFSQHSILRSRLLQTGDSEIINASPTDVFWGSGRAAGSQKPGVGRNELGKALMRTRETLLESAGLGWGSGAKTV